MKLFTKQKQTYRLREPKQSYGCQWGWWKGDKWGLWD